MDTKEKADKAAELVRALIEGRTQDATDKAGALIRDGIAENMAGFSATVQSLATAMRTMPGDIAGMSSKLAMITYNALGRVRAVDLAFVVLNLAANQAREINEARDRLYAGTGRPLGRPIKDNPQG